MMKKNTAIFFILTLFSLGHCPLFAAINGKVIYVAKTGNDANDGSVKAPLLTISKAEAIAHAGDKIIVHKGIYREMISLHTGGTLTGGRISYVAASGEDVTIKGSERVKSWVKEGDNTWRVEIGEAFFNGFNPFAKLVNPDSSFVHLGGVYLENSPLSEKKDISAVSSQPNSWFATQQYGKTVILANFGNADPNLKLAEINVRPAAFFAQAGVSFIHLNGLNIAQVASQMASINKEQPGAIALNGGTHWLIENCTISDCKSVGISIGQAGHDYPAASPPKPEYSDLSQDIANVGRETIRHNHIFRCGQAAIFGLLHGTFSEITDNLIEDINSDDNYPGETSGIHLALAVDVLIRHNLIRHIKGTLGGYGLFLGPLFQGAHISSNIISGTAHSCLFCFNSHGPDLIDNNIFSGPGAQTNAGIKIISSEANVFVQNLFYNCGFVNDKVPGKPFATSNYLPHSLIIKQTIPALPLDGRWYSNLFIKTGLSQIVQNPDCEIDYNTYLDGAAGASWADKHSRTVAGNAGFKLMDLEKSASFYFNSKLVPKSACPKLTPSFIGFFALSKQYLEYPDGKPILNDHDFNGTVLTGAKKLAGPFYKYPDGNKKQLLFSY